MTEVGIDEVFGLPAQVVDQPHGFRIGFGRAIGIKRAINKEQRSVSEALGMRLGGVFGAPVIAPTAALRFPAPFIGLVKAGAAHDRYH
ncbi:MAG: hypothetical protein OXG85_13165, partial [Chloroflexi bacterium]|nr:hypothetical protein [Chloroflexota bacterium]